jgi:uncharacterized protein
MNHKIPPDASMNRSEAIEKVRAYKHLLEGHLPLENVYLYGAYANNTQKEDSNIDVAVVVRRIEGDYFSVSPLIWRLRRQVDRRIEPILIEREFDDAVFLGEVRKYGIDIA